MDFSYLFIFSVGCLFFAFSEVVWTYSLHIEVFALNHLFIAILLNLMFSIQYKTRKNQSCRFSILLGAFFSGLSLCNQQ